MEKIKKKNLKTFYKYNSYNNAHPIVLNGKVYLMHSGKSLCRQIDEKLSFFYCSIINDLITLFYLFSLLVYYGKYFRSRVTTVMIGVYFLFIRKNKVYGV